MPAKSVYENIYDKLAQIIPNLETVNSAGKSQALGYMDLNLDVLEETKDYRVIALSHYYKHPSGDMVADPDMAIRIWKGQKTAEALHYQDMFRYDQVYGEDGTVNLKLKRDLNSFLSQWLTNLIEQGHRFAFKEQATQ